jgi:hypothetical protein
MPFVDGIESLRERARLVVLVPVERVGDDEALRRRQPSECTSVMNTSKPGEILPALDDAESAACLIEFVVSPPAFAKPDDLGLSTPAPAAGTS